MSAIAAFLSSERVRTISKSPDERKGLILSHLLGLCLFSEFVFSFIKAEIPLTPVLQVPIRLVGLWLLIDRNWRVARFRFSTWDYLILGFVTLTGIGVLVTAATSPELPVALEDYRRFLGVYLGMYLYYLVMKEGLNRKGFRPDIAINWLLAGLAFSALLGLAQAINIPHVRDWALRHYKLERDTMNSDYISSTQASGTAASWNHMSFEMLVAFALAFAPSFRRKPHKWEIALGILFMAAFVATQSRGGLIAFAACAIGAVIFFWWNHKPKKALVIGAFVGAAVFIWGFSVFALHIERFTRTIQGEKVRSSVYLNSIDIRVARQMEALRIGMKRPFFGTGPNSILFPGDSPRVMMFSDSSLMGAIDGQYFLAFAQFGLVGTALVLAMFGYLMSFVRRSVAYRPYAFALFLIGIAVTTHGLVEFLLYARAWVIIHAVVALASSKVLQSESGRALSKRGVPIQARIDVGPALEPGVLNPE
jgi:hypothetical protein